MAAFESFKHGRFKRWIHNRRLQTASAERPSFPLGGFLAAFGESFKHVAPFRAWFRGDGGDRHGQGALQGSDHRGSHAEVPRAARPEMSGEFAVWGGEVGRARLFFVAGTKRCAENLLAGGWIFELELSGSKVDPQKVQLFAEGSTATKKTHMKLARKTSFLLRGPLDSFRFLFLAWC